MKKLMCKFLFQVRRMVGKIVPIRCYPVVPELQDRNLQAQAYPQGVIPHEGSIKSLASRFTMRILYCLSEGMRDNEWMGPV
jgi:hypothetical protein